jgi:hypothetical protein
MFKQVGNFKKVSRVLEYVTDRYTNCGKSRQYGGSDDIGISVIEIEIEI